MTAIGKHSWVECINDAGQIRAPAWHHVCVGPDLVAGRTYYVEAVEYGCSEHGHGDGLLLSGQCPDCVYNPARFRPMGGERTARPAKISEDA